MPDTSNSRPTSPVSDRGFTLVELVVAIAVTAVVATSLAAGIVAILKSQAATQQRITESSDQQNLVVWLPADLSSTPPANLETTSSLASGCQGSSPGTSVLRLTWTEAVNGTTTTFRVNYRATVDGTALRLKRYYCTGTSLLGAPFILTVSNALPNLPPGWTVGQPPIAVSSNSGIVRLALTQADSRVVSIDSSQKNPAATLPPTPATVAPTTVAATTTTVAATTTTVAATTTTVAATTTTVGGTTTTVAGTTTTTAAAPTTTTTAAPTTTAAAATTTTAVPCVVGTMALSPGHVQNTANGQGAGLLRQDVVVTITVTGGCQFLQLEYDTGGSNGLRYQAFVLAGASYTVTLKGTSSGGTEVWAKGSRTLNVTNSNVALQAASLTVT